MQCLNRAELRRDFSSNAWLACLAETLDEVTHGASALFGGSLQQEVRSIDVRDRASRNCGKYPAAGDRGKQPVSGGAQVEDGHGNRTKARRGVDAHGSGCTESEYGWAHRQEGVS
jgi:hypothetical protein